jgi:hypothetical protein
MVSYIKGGIQAKGIWKVFEYLGPRGMRMGSGAMRNFIPFFTVHLI